MPPKFRGSKVLVGIISNDAARFSEFGASVVRLQAPPGCEIEWVIGGDWCSARNSLAQLCVDGHFTHLWFMDDDHSFAPDILMKLLRHDQPLINPMCLTRTWPFQPVITVKDGVLDLDSVPERGLVELVTGGCAGMLIRRDVLEAIPAPWFEYSDRSEDVIFCEKALAAGFPLHGDLEAKLGHITTAVVWPSYNPEHGWMTGLTIGKEMQMQIPLTADLMNHNIKRIEVPFTGEEPTTTDDLVDAISDAFEGLGDRVVASEPCLICGQQSTWRDVHGQQGCAEHDPTHSAWSTFYERAEIWLDLSVRDGSGDQRWYYRLLRGDGTIAVRSERGHTHERDVIAEINEQWPGLSVHHVNDESDDSRATRTGPPLRLWNRNAT